MREITFELPGLTPSIGDRYTCKWDRYHWGWTVQNVIYSLSSRCVEVIMKCEWDNDIRNYGIEMFLYTFEKEAC